LLFTPTLIKWGAQTLIHFRTAPDFSISSLPSLPFLPLFLPSFSVFSYSPSPSFAYINDILSLEMMGPPSVRITPFPSRPLSSDQDEAIPFPPLSQPNPVRPNQNHPQFQPRQPNSRPVQAFQFSTPVTPRNRSQSITPSHYPLTRENSLSSSISQSQSYSYDPAPPRQNTPARNVPNVIIDSYRPITPISGPPRNAAEIYAQSLEPKVSMGDKIINAITGKSIHFIQ